MVLNKSHFDILNHLDRTHKCDKDSDGRTLS